MTNSISSVNNYLIPVASSTGERSVTSQKVLANACFSNSSQREEALYYSFLPPFIEKLPQSSQSAQKLALLELPALVILNILCFSSVQTLCRCACTSKRLNEMVSDPGVWATFDLKREFKLLNIIDETTWQIHVNLKEHELTFEDAPPFAMRTTIRTIKKMLHDLPIEPINGVNLGITVALFPAGLTLNKLGNIAKNPKSGKALNFSYVYEDIVKKHGDTPIDKPYRAVITNNILQGTRGLTYNDQRAFVEGRGYQMPTLIEAITSATLPYIISLGADSLGYNLRTYSRVLEKIPNSDLPLVVGFCTLGSLYVNEDENHVNFGSRGLQKF